MHKFEHIYYDPVHVHVLSNILLILRRSNRINTASGIVTLSKWPSGAQVAACFLNIDAEFHIGYAVERRSTYMSSTMPKFGVLHIS